MEIWSCLVSVGVNYLVHVPGPSDRLCRILWFWSASMLLSIFPSRMRALLRGHSVLWARRVLSLVAPRGGVHCCHAFLRPLKGNDDRGDWDFALPAMHIRHTDRREDKLITASTGNCGLLSNETLRMIECINVHLQERSSSCLPLGGNLLLSPLLSFGPDGSFKTHTKLF